MAETSKPLPPSILQGHTFDRLVQEIWKIGKGINSFYVQPTLVANTIEQQEWAKGSFETLGRKPEKARQKNIMSKEIYFCLVANES